MSEFSDLSIEEIKKITDLLYTLDYLIEFFQKIRDEVKILYWETIYENFRDFIGEITRAEVITEEKMLSYDIDKIADIIENELKDIDYDSAIELMRISKELYTDSENFIKEYILLLREIDEKMSNKLSIIEYAIDAFNGTVRNTEDIELFKKVLDGTVAEVLRFILLTCRHLLTKLSNKTVKELFRESIMLYIAGYEISDMFKSYLEKEGGEKERILKMLSKRLAILATTGRRVFVHILEYTEDLKIDKKILLIKKVKYRITSNIVENYFKKF